MNEFRSVFKLFCISNKISWLSLDSKEPHFFTIGSGSDCCNNFSNWTLIGASLSELHTSGSFVGSSFYEYK